MQLIDSHTHLYSRNLQPDLAQVIQRAVDEGVDKMYLPAIDAESHEAMLALEASFPQYFRSMMGLHPCSVNERVEEELALVKDWLAKRRFAAIGEIGLDYYWDRTHEEAQREAFRRQMDWAKAYRLPVVIHSRESMDDSIRLVKEAQDGSLTGIFHCFTGSVEQGRQIMDLGFYLGIGGVLTYKNSGLPEVVKELGMERLVLETDAPYLTPVPFRGKRNESSYIIYVARKLADLTGLSVEEVAGITTANAEKVFGSWD